MLRFLADNAINLLTILVLIAALVYIIYLVYKKKWDDLRIIAYGLFIKAEKSIVGNKRGQERFDIVAQQIYYKMPYWFKLLVPRETMEKQLQLWFDILWIDMKDILDNGKRDKSATFEPVETDTEQRLKLEPDKIDSGPDSTDQ